MPEDTPAYYSAAEAREFAGLLLRGSVRVLRGKDTKRVDERIDRLKQRAAERCQAERDAVEAEAHSLPLPGVEREIAVRWG